MFFCIFRGTRAAVRPLDEAPPSPSPLPTAGAAALTFALPAGDGDDDAHQESDYESCVEETMFMITTMIAEFDVETQMLEVKIP